MGMKKIVVFLFLLVSFNGWGLNNDSLLNNVESYLINNDVDLAENEFNKISNLKNDYLISLKAFFNETDSYSDLEILIKKISMNNPSQLAEVHRVFNIRLNAPKTSIINIDYVIAKWNLFCTVAKKSFVVGLFES